MKRITHLFIFALLSLLALQFVACSEDADCSETARKMMYASFYKKSNTAVRDTIDSLTVSAFGTDSVLVNLDLNTIGETLPLNWTADSTLYVFHYISSGKFDTINVHHTNVPTFVSMECGYSMAQTLKKVKYTKHVLDSIHLVYSLANSDEIQNIKIYY
jgi:hypothetical protein